MEKNENIIQVQEKDLNGIDALNGKGHASTKDGFEPLDDNGDYLKGAIGRLSIFNSQIRALEEQQWIQMFKNQLFDLQAMNFKYSNLPEELDIIRIETKPFENGSSAWVKVLGKIYVVNYNTQEFNLYDEPTQIEIIEPKAQALNGKVFHIGKNAEIFRNNPKMQSVYARIYRYLKALEKTLFQIEKNLTSSAPKGLINPKNNTISASFEEDGENPMQNSFEMIVNGQNTFYVLKNNNNLNIKNADDNPFWIPMELTDRTENLIKNYTFFKEQIKELMGETQNVHQKKERVNTEEIAQQRGLAEKTKRAMYETRLIDLERINKTFGTNIMVELVEPDPDKDSQTDGEESGETDE